MNISYKLKERFVRDFKIPIRLYAEPYFTDRLALYDSIYNTVKKWKSFITEVNKFSNEEEYFAEYNRVKEAAMDFIKSSEAYTHFNELDMNKYAVDPTYRSLPGKDIYHTQNIGKRFISIDMKKANFSCLKHFDRSIFDADTWEEFISKFTANQNIINSKYIREVIMGNCNPKRQITYEKYLMSQILNRIIALGIDMSRVVFFSNDEIIFDITDVTDNSILDIINSFVGTYSIPLRVETFKLQGIKDDEKMIGFIKIITDGEFDFKCLNHINTPWVIHKLNNEDIQENDLVFEHEGKLAKYINKPNISLIL